MFADEDFQTAALQLCATGKELYQRGWSPATSSNYSIRLNEHCCALTSSGKHKGELTPSDILVVDWQGQALTLGKPSAETLLHTQLYARDANIGAVLHTHSINAVIVSHLWPEDSLDISGFEIQKAFAGQKNHTNTLSFPIFANSQEINQLALEVEQVMQTKGQGYGYLIRGHGLYTWGANLSECFRHLEAFEQLLAYQLELLKIRGRS